MSSARYEHLNNDSHSDMRVSEPSPIVTAYADSPEFSHHQFDTEYRLHSSPGFTAHNYSEENLRDKRSIKSINSNASQRSHSPNFLQRWITDWWLWELMCATFGVILMIALVVLLRSYDQKPGPQWKTSWNSTITLNAIVSLLIAFTKVSLLYCIAECLGQLKWIWYSKSYRSLHDIESFDRASRGPYGGFELIGTTKLKSIATLGAILMIIGFTIDPLAQQLVVYEFRFTIKPNDTVTVPVQNLWAEKKTSVLTFANPDPFDYISPTMKGAVQAGLYNGGAPVENIAATCGVGNCTWDKPYLSLAVCARSTDISDKLQYHNLTAQYNDHNEVWSLTDKSFIANQRSVGFINVTQVAPDANFGTGQSKIGQQLDFSRSIAFEDVKYPIADAFVIYYNGTTSKINQPSYSAFEFVLEWCVQTFNTTVDNSRSETNRTDAFRGFTSPHDEDDSNTDKNPRLIKDGDAYSIDINTHTSLQRYLYDVFHGDIMCPNATEIAGKPIPPADQWQWYTNPEQVQAFFQPFNVFQVKDSKDLATQARNQTGFNQILENIATSMTNHIRSTNPSSNFTGNQATGDSYISVQWPWFAGPLAFTIGCLVFLAATIVYQANGLTRNGTWRTSSLAVLHSTNPELQSRLQGMKHTSSMNLQSRGTFVKLFDQPEGGWRLFARKEQ